MLRKTGSASISGVVRWHGPVPEVEMPEAFRDSATGIRLVLEGRLHDEAELRRSCGAAVHHSPHEVLLRAYLAWGEDCPRRILGEYAFAIWDPAAGRLLCARDSAGIRPLFFAEFPGGAFGFATTIPQLLAAGVPQELDTTGTVDFLTSRGSLAPARTCWKHIRRLGAAGRVVVGPSGAHVSRYWSTSEIPETSTDRDGGVEACATALQAAIGDRLEGAPRAGITLSGGWDSGVVFSLWQWMRTRQPHLPEPWFYTYYGDTSEADERAEVRALLCQWPARGQFAPLDAAGALTGLSDHIARLGLPETASGWRWSADMGAAASGAGIATLLTGEGGNEVFRSSILAPLALLRARCGREALHQMAAWVREIDSTMPRFAWRYVVRPALSLWAPRLLDAWRPEATPAYLTDQAREMARALLAEAARRRRQNYQGGPSSTWERRLSLEAWWDELFPLSYALDLEGVSASVPFLDRRMMLAALPALSAQGKFHSTRDLPAAVLRVTTGLPFQGRYAHYTRFLNQALAAALPRFDAVALAELGIVHPGRLRKLLDTNPHPAPLWPLISAETWARHCLLKRIPKASGQAHTIGNGY